MQIICRKTKIRIRDLRVQCCVGVHQTERASRQPVIFNLELTLVEAEVRADSIDATVDYRDVVGQVGSMATDHACVTLEELARRVGQNLLVDQRLKAVRVRVEKPHKLPDCDAVGVDRTFTRPAPSVRMGAVVLYCADLEESQQFYNHLGFTFKPEKHGPKQPRHYAAEQDGFLLELYPQKKERRGKRAPDPARLTFRVGDLASTVAQMPKKNMVREGAREGVVVFVDPDGRFVEIIQA